MRTLPRRVAGLSLVVVVAAAGVAGAQAVPPAKSPTILWAQCPGDTVDTVGPITFDDVAKAAKPVLWFSRDEPLLEANNGVLPLEWPRTTGPPQDGPKRQAYYRVRRLKSSKKGDVAAIIRARLAPDERAFVTKTTAHPEAVAAIPLDAVMDHLQSFDIRYFFYYPNEFGVGRHPHDFETIELHFAVERADVDGNPWNEDRTKLVCRQIRVSRFYGSAHGLGAYTNALDFDKILREWFKEPKGTPFTDPFWPLLVFVEEGKHASAPDRNGDGVYTPGFDVNKYESDAWGVRDTMRANRLAPAFSGDTFKQRIPEIKTDWKNKVSPVNDERDAYALAKFRQYVSHDYLLKRATDDVEICGPPMPLRPASERNRSLDEYDLRLKAHLKEKGLEPGHPREKLRERGFCEDVHIDGSFDLVDIAHAVRWGGSAVFARFGETFTVSLRYDHSVGWTAVSPMEIELPGVGGRIVGRMTSEGLTFDRDGLWNLKSVDLLYMRSAAKFADFYLGVGVDDRRPAGHDPAERPEGAGRFDVALELGFRVRMPIPKFGVFLGGRIGVRSNDFTNLRNIRLVTEVGSAIW